MTFELKKKIYLLFERERERVPAHGREGASGTNSFSKGLWGGFSVLASCNFSFFFFYNCLTFFSKNPKLHFLINKR